MEQNYSRKSGRFSASNPHLAESIEQNIDDVALMLEIRRLEEKEAHIEGRIWEQVSLLRTINKRERDIITMLIEARKIDSAAKEEQIRRERCELRQFNNCQFQQYQEVPHD